MAAPAPLYLDTSAVLRATLESGTTREIEKNIAEAPMLITSRLSLVESARAFLRVRQIGKLSEARIADAERDVAVLWRHCELWEVNPAVCDFAQQVAAGRPLRTLDAIHLATFALARRKIAGLEMLTADERLRDAVKTL